jgi:hypothetical protein
VVDHGDNTDEAMRVATTVIAVAGDTREVASVHPPLAEATSKATTVVITDLSNIDQTRRQAMIDHLQAEADEVRSASLDDEAFANLAPGQVVVLLEGGVLPVPGAIQAAARAVAAQPTEAVSGKVIDATGRMESAGGTVFADRSVGLVGHGTHEVSAPWLDFVRPVCWAPGVMALSAELCSEVAQPAHLSGRAFLREWCSNLWAAGHRVVHHPAVATTRVAGSGTEPATPLSETGWQRVLDLRPNRPDDLGDGAWRYLLGHDDVDACRT